MTRRLLGVVLFASLFATSLAVLDSSTHVRDLEVLLDDDRPVAFTSFPAIVRGAVPAARLRDRVVASLDGTTIALPLDDRGLFELPLAGAGPGLHFLTWSVVYGERWERTAELAYIEGPFSTAPSPDCNAQVGIAQVFLDDGDDDRPGDLANALAPAILDRINVKLMERGFPSATYLELRLTALHDGIRVSIDVPSFFRLATSIRLSPDSTGQTLEAARTSPVEQKLYSSFESRVRAAGYDEAGLVGAFLCGATFGVFCGYIEHRAGKEARSQLEAAVDQILPSMSDFLRLPNNAQLAGGPPVGAAYCGSPTGVEGRFLAVPIRISVETTPSRSVPGLSGPVVLGGHRPPPSLRGDIFVDVSPDVVNALLYGLWQRGTLRRHLSSPESMAAMNSALNDLSVSLVGLDPVLPPVFLPAREAVAFELQVGELHLALIDKRDNRSSTAAMSGIAVLSLVDSELSVDLLRIGVSCVRTADNKSIRYPCFSDVLQLATDLLRGPDGTPVVQAKLELDSLLSQLQPPPESHLALEVHGISLQQVPATVPWVGFSANITLIHEQ